MKQKMILSLLALSIDMLQAGAQKEQNLVVKAGEAKELSLSENLNVVLLQASATDTAFTMNKATGEELKVKLSGNKLQIEARRHLPKGTTVYVMVKNLDKLTVGYNTKVRTSGVLQASNLHVYIDGRAVPYLLTTGNVKRSFDVNINVAEEANDMIKKGTK